MLFESVRIRLIRANLCVIGILNTAQAAAEDVEGGQDAGVGAKRITSGLGDVFRQKWLDYIKQHVRHNSVSFWCEVSIAWNQMLWPQQVMRYKIGLVKLVDKEVLNIYSWAII